MTKFILDSGDPQEYKSTVKLAADHGSEIWGSTTNPSLIAKKLAQSGKKLTTDQAFALQKDVVMEILTLVPGAVSAEVYADTETRAEEMVKQAQEIAKWSERVVIKLPTTLEGFKARTEVRKENITVNNTLVFSQPQIYAICLHEHLSQKEFGATSKWPCFISPFIGRLDDIGEDGTALVAHGMELKKEFTEKLWMLAASIRSTRHLADSIELESELVTAPSKVYVEWFTNGEKPSEKVSGLTVPPLWQPTEEIKKIDSIDTFHRALTDGILDISHPLTDKGIAKFTEDWKAILQ